jgi:hypothetical protein
VLSISSPMLGLCTALITALVLFDGARAFVSKADVRARQVAAAERLDARMRPRANSATHTHKYEPGAHVKNITFTNPRASGAHQPLSESYCVAERA